MFNALSSDQLLTGIGHVLRAAAATEGPLDDYQRSQLLSAFSITRLLAAEQAAQADLLTWTQTELLATLSADTHAETATARAQIEAATTGLAIGDALTDLLASLPREHPTRTAVHSILHQMVDGEVAALA